MRIDHLDHLVLTVADIERSIAFYTNVLGMEAVTFGEGRRAVRFGRGDQRINLQQIGRETPLRAGSPTPGSADLCFLLSPISPVEDARDELIRKGIALESEIVIRDGAAGPLRSLYLRDPDGNLIELSSPA